MNKLVITQKELSEFSNNSNLQMLSKDDFDNALNISNKIISIKISTKEFNKKVIKDISNIKAVFVIIEILKDEPMKEIYTNIYNGIATMVRDDITLLFDINIVSEISNETISLIVFYD